MKTETVIAQPVKSRKVVMGATNRQSRLAIKKILAPTDFSPASENALRYALRLGSEFGSEIMFLHILEPIMPLTYDGLALPPTVPEPDSCETEKALKALVVSARERGITKARAMFRRGIPSHEIVETAREMDVDLIVMATHGYTGWKHFAIGSTAERVVRAAPCPVLVVREKEHDFV